MPPAVLELVHQRRTRSAVNPTERPARSHERRKQIAPSAPTRTEGMAASFAPRRWEGNDTIPAIRARETAIASIIQAAADDARARKQQVECGMPPTAPRAARLYHRFAAAASASRITSRGAAMPNHHSNASAPCSSNMQKPSSAAWPRCLADFTHAVSPGR
jgi:hypothetical protein